ncbi:MAG: HD domain-containing protein [Nitrospirae bacterium]|nr:HD domain-containing protein [Nitrospirota bacterium]
MRLITVNLGNLVLSLSDAMDLASPLLSQHQQRTAFIAWELGKAARLSEERLERMFIAALLHDIGAFSVEEKVALLKSEVDVLGHHCIRGDVLLEGVPWLKDSAKIVRFHHKEWKAWKDLKESVEMPVVFESQILNLADCVERQINRSQYILHQHEGIMTRISSRAGSMFSPEVVDLFFTVSGREEFWLDLVSSRLYSLLLHNGPFRKTEIDLSEISSISELFRNIIDFRSRFTATHSSGVAAAASMLSRIFGLTEMETKLMEVAGDLHDIGKLAIPNSILDKPGKLTKEEMAVIKSHTYYTYSVINTIGGIKQIAEWAAYHHEKLDGSGYPFHCRADDLSTGSRIMMVADIFTAIAEDRPYRQGMSREGIIKILKQFSDQRLLDSKIINLLIENYDEIYSYVVERQAVARDFYEKQFAFLDNTMKMEV